jgi:hypothetical protein
MLLQLAADIALFVVLMEFFVMVFAVKKSAEMAYHKEFSWADSFVQFILLVIMLFVVDIIFTITFRTPLVAVPLLKLAGLA